MARNVPPEVCTVKRFRREGGRVRDAAGLASRFWTAQTSAARSTPAQERSTRRVLTATCGCGWGLI